MNKKSKHNTYRKPNIKQTPEKIIKEIIKKQCANYVKDKCVYDKDCNLLKEQFEDCNYFMKNIYPALSEEDKRVVDEYKKNKIKEI